MDTKAILLHMARFEAEIRECVSGFERTFNTSQPNLHWRKGEIPRVGMLNDTGYEYSLHGRGCTVTVGDRIVSFDFDSEGQFAYSPFKLLSYLDDDSLSLREVEALFVNLCSNGMLRVIEGLGVRLSEKAEAETK